MDLQRCKYCIGKGNIKCINCNFNTHKRSCFTESTIKICTYCINGFIVCPMCGGDGKDYSIFM